MNVGNDPLDIQSLSMFVGEGCGLATVQTPFGVVCKTACWRDRQHMGSRLVYQRQDAERAACCMVQTCCFQEGDTSAAEDGEAGERRTAALAPCT